VGARRPAAEVQRVLFQGQLMRGMDSACSMPLRVWCMRVFMVMSMSVFMVMRVGVKIGRAIVVRPGRL